MPSNRSSDSMSMNFGPGAYRFFLAMLVLVHHTSSLGLGAGAVYVFFCLSGYWMHTVWEKKYAKADHGYRTFILARLIRLLAMFWLASIIGFACEAYLGRFPVAEWWERMQSLPAVLHFVLSHVFLVGYQRLEHMILMPAWSLDTEMQFYLVLPLMVLVMRSLGWLVLPLSALMCLWLQVSVGRETVLSYVFFFYLGMFASHVRWAPSARLAYTSLMLTVLIAVCLIAMPSTRSVLIGGTGQNELYRHWNDLANAVLAVMVLPLTIWSAEIKAGQRDRMLGDMSYAVYLIHAPLVMFYSLWFGQLPLLQRLPYWVGMVLVVSGVYWLAWRCVDKPVMAWRERYLRSRI